MRGLKFVWIAFALSLILASFTPAQFPPAPGTGPGLPETIEAIDSARVTTRILYITAHPDDESAAVLTYLARGLHADVALLSLTRGEGGQNALGPEHPLSPVVALAIRALDQSRQRVSPCLSHQPLRS